MSFSTQLIDLYKEKFSIKTDSEAGEAIPKLGKQNLYAVRKGKNHLTEEQVIWLAGQCQMDAALALVELAADKSKSETAKSVWSNLAKKLKATAQVTAVAVILLFSQVHEPFAVKRLKHIP